MGRTKNWDVKKERKKKQNERPKNVVLILLPESELPQPFPLCLRNPLFFT